MVKLDEEAKASMQLNTTMIQNWDYFEWNWSQQHEQDTSKTDEPTNGPLTKLQTPCSYIDKQMLALCAFQQQFQPTQGPT